MTIEEVRQKILVDDHFVIDELKKVQNLYELKREIRYTLKRDTMFETESVAEHTWGMHCIADYFLPLYSHELQIDEQKVRTMIQYHDIDEVITGDVPRYEKQESTSDEVVSAEVVLRKLPIHMQDKVSAIVQEYYAQTTWEARFVKALDKTEPAFQCYQATMKPVFVDHLKITLKTGGANAFEYLKEFPLMLRFSTVVGDYMEREGYFVSEPKNES